jgi:hypothetical protein
LLYDRVELNKILQIFHQTRMMQNIGKHLGTRKKCNISHNTLEWETAVLTFQPTKQALFFFAVLGFELKAYTLSHSTNIFWVIFFLFEIGTCKLFARLNWRCNPPDLCLRRSS